MRTILAVLVALACVPLPATPQAGALFSYRPDDGWRAEFETQYRAHLDWHREHADSLVWWGWDVIAGPRLGEFVDGVFGVPFAAFDARVDPRGDAANGEATYRPLSTATGRELLRLRPDLGTATPLEDRDPTPLVQVVQVRGGPREAAAIADALAELRRAARTGTFLPFTVYETVAGRPPGFVLMVWRRGLASFDEPSASPDVVLRAILAAGGGGRIDIADELWLYRRDLTYLPGQEGE